jgi:uncharacterized protein (DUF1810 family)
VSDDLDRFIRAQDSPQSGLAAALDELRGDGKRTHWIWYVFPQLRGLGNSWNSEFYGIDGVEEAVAYLTHPVLRRRLLQATGIVAEQLGGGVSLRHLFGGDTDARKLVSSLTLFRGVAERASLPDRDVVELRELSRLANEVLTRASEQGYSPCRLTIDVLERADA